MSEGFNLIKKMEPMARKAMAEMEAMENAIHYNNRDDVAKHLENAMQALSVVQSDLELHDKWTKLASNEPTEQQLGQILKFDNTEGNVSANDGAIALGVIRAGRTDKIYRPHRVYLEGKA